MTRVAVLLPIPPGDRSWADAAVAAANALPESVQVDYIIGLPHTLPDADIVLAHGIQYEPLVRTAPQDTTIILSDRPVDLHGLERITVVDWAWAEAARVAGEVAAVAAGGAPIGLIAGPAVRTQRRLTSAFAAGVEAVATGSTTHIVHLPSFDAVDGAQRTGRQLVAELGCTVLLTSADAAGDAAAVEARRLGASTFGFLNPHDEDLGYVRSDVGGVLAGLLARAIDAEPLPQLVHAGLASGHLRFELRADAPSHLRERRDDATRAVVSQPDLAA
ncbi:BMP family ABC transporter substrate-binding protein [uncultured Aeromicrobium sp.]|uniref:BMP family ABC transporter substrate-binding protein n=1 Tax=uncultured Aeromicrobium sp. TaxID=337820 RepID=UPI0025EE8740|nr:BMP family ABC transporter substrate-binding protein [uncultured Aeromicrobium sp.]